MGRERVTVMASIAIQMVQISKISLQRIKILPEVCQGLLVGVACSTQSSPLGFSDKTQLFLEV